MFGIDDALIAAGIGGITSAFGQHSANESNARIGQQNNDFSARQADINRSFQERMSSTSWQRGVADMRSAGVNPMLAVSQGGASSPSGNSAQGIAQANQQNELQGMASSAKDAIMLKLQAENLKQQTETSRQQAKMYGQQANLNMVNMNNAAENNILLKAQQPGARLQADIDSSSYGKALAISQRLGINLNSALSLVKSGGSVLGKYISK